MLKLFKHYFRHHFFKKFLFLTFIIFYNKNNFIHLQFIFKKQIQSEIMNKLFILFLCSIGIVGSISLSMHSILQFTRFLKDVEENNISPRVFHKAIMREVVRIITIACSILLFFYYMYIMLTVICFNSHKVKQFSISCSEFYIIVGILCTIIFYILFHFDYYTYLFGDELFDIMEQESNCCGWLTTEMKGCGARFVYGDIQSCYNAVGMKLTLNTCLVFVVFTLIVTATMFGLKATDADDEPEEKDDKVKKN